MRPALHRQAQLTAALRQRLRRSVPEGLKPALRATANRLDPLVVALHRRRTGDPRPIPPRGLRASVGQPSIAPYLEEGAHVAAEVRGVLEELGRPLESFNSICDLASGPGKVLTALEVPARMRVAAIDVNRAAIAWLCRRRPEIDARAEPAVPPTSFPRASFDLLLSISLFTHLSEQRQDAWLAEVARLLRPGGVGVLTVHGETAYEGFRSGRRPGILDSQLRALRGRGSLADEGFVFEPEPDPAGRLPGVEEEWGLAFHSGDYLATRWAEVLSVDRVLPAALNFRQDAVIVSARSSS